MRKQNHIASFLVLMLALPAFANADVDKAIALYKKGDMAGCANILRAACSSTAANNPLAHYYFANSLVAQNRLMEARKHYEAVLQLVPSGPFRAQTITALRSIGGTVPTASAATPAAATGTQEKSGPKRGFLGLTLVHANEVDQIVPKSPAAEAGVKPGDFLLSVDGQSTTGRDGRFITSLLVGMEGTEVECEFDHAGKRYKVTMKRIGQVDFNSVAGVRGRTGPATADKLDNIMVTKLQQTADTATVYKEVIQALAAIPKQVKEELAHSDVKVVIAPSITDARPDLKGVRPEAYVHGGDYENCPGMYDHGPRPSTYQNVARSAAVRKKSTRVRWK